MSVAVQAHQTRAKFGVDTAQFEEIIAPKDDRAAISTEASSSKMNKGSDTETQSNKEGNKKSQKKDSKSYYSSEEDSYDNDFESDAGESPRKSVVKDTARNSPSPKRNSSRINTSRSPETRTKSPSVISPRSSKKGKRKRRFKPYESPRSSSPATSRIPPEKNWGKPKNRSANVKASRIDHTVVDRVLSANRHKVTKLESRLSQLIKELTKEREENRTLRLIQHRQEKKLEKVIGEEAELPQLLVKHTAEVKSFRERIRKLQDTSYHKDEKIGEQDKTILKLQDKCKYYRELCEKEELTEKAELEKNLSKAEENLKKREEEISKLQRMLNLKEKTHSRNLKEHKEKLREAQERFQLLEENCNNLQGKLRVREKQLDYTNIYQRQIVLKEKSPVPPDSPPKMAALPAPKRTKPKGKNNTNANKTKGNKAKETKNDAGGKDGESSKKPNSVFLTAQSDKDSGSDRDINKNKQGNNDKDLLSITDGKNSSNNGSNGGQAMVNGNNGVSEDELNNSERRRREEFERNLREEDERLKKEKEEVERRLKEIQEREELEKTEREAKWREDSARRAREAEERQLASARRRKEEERIAEERREEERRREDERRREEERRDQEKKALQKDDSFFEDEESRRKKDALLARLKAIDSDKASDEDLQKFENKKSPRGDDFWKPQASKSYEARKADQNLHNGLPAVPRESQVFSPPKENKVISPAESVMSDPDGVFGVPRHKPALLGRGGLTKKKDNQFSLLDDNKKPAANKNKAKPDDGFNFGDYSPSTSDNKKKSDDVFDTGLSRRAGEQGRRRQGGLGDNGFDFGERRGSGGIEKTKPQNNSLGFLSDDFGSKRGGEQSSGSPGNKSQLLPRRRAAQERSGPTAISSAFDDDLDIEEFTL